LRRGYKETERSLGGGRRLDVDGVAGVLEVEEPPRNGSLHLIKSLLLRRRHLTAARGMPVKTGTRAGGID
jgi:hypothetical protein